MRYAAYGHVIDSAAALVCLPPSAAESADITIDVTATPPPAGPWRGESVSDTDPWLQVSCTEMGCVLRFESAVTCSVTPDGRTIRVHSALPLSDTAQHLLVDQVLPLVIAHRGRLVLHGAGLRLASRGIGLVGPSGAGKSTLAGSLVSRGAAVFSDDALVMDLSVVPAGAHPSYPGLRVWPDVLAAVGGRDNAPSVADYTDKRRVALTAVAPWLDAIAIHRVYTIAPEPAPSIAIARLTKRDAAVALLTHSYVLDPADTRRLGAQFDLACRLVERIEVRALRYPRDLARLPDVGSRLMDDLET